MVRLILGVGQTKKSKSMNKTFKILTLIFVLSAIIFAEESNEKRSLDTVQQIFKALENKDINEFSALPESQWE
jgi:hypothetical protein